MAMLTEDFDALAGAISRSFIALSNNRSAIPLTAYKSAFKAAESQVLTINETLRESYPDTFQSARFLKLAFDGAVEG